VPRTHGLGARCARSSRLAERRRVFRQPVAAYPRRAGATSRRHGNRLGRVLSRACASPAHTSNETRPPSPRFTLKLDARRKSPDPAAVIRTTSSSSTFDATGPCPESPQGGGGGTRTPSCLGERPAVPCRSAARRRSHEISGGFKALLDRRPDRERRPRKSYPSTTRIGACYRGRRISSTARRTVRVPRCAANTSNSPGLDAPPPIPERARASPRLPPPTPIVGGVEAGNLAPRSLPGLVTVPAGGVAPEQLHRHGSR